MADQNIQNATSGTNHALANELLKPENWPTPQWFAENKATKIRTYEEHFTFQLRARYVELENEFRSVVGNFPGTVDFITAARSSDILHTARGCLEQETTELLTVSSSLDLVERYMVWLYPDWVGKARISGLLLRLESLSFNGRDILIKELTELSKPDKQLDKGQLRSVLYETIGLMNAQVIQDRIGRGLQINRLRYLRLWGSITLFILFIVSPLATNLSAIEGWPSQLIFGQSLGLPTWLNALVMMTLGAVGGFLSGLLQARNTQVTLTEYLENMLKLQLRPLVGALVALILYTFLSWQVLPGITIENAGSYFVIAFLSGFSERYFLRLLKTESEESSEANKTPEQTNLTGS